MSTTDLAEAVVEFAAGSEANWNNFALPIPSNVVIFTTDTQKFKRGDGEHRFTDLPDGPSIAGIANSEETVLNVLSTLIPADNDSIIVIDSEIYKASTTKLTTIMARISAIANTDTIQDANMDTIVSQSNMVDQSVAVAPDGALAIITNHKMSPGILAEGLIVSQDEPPVFIESYGIFSDKACTIPVDTFNYSSTYYAKVVGQHDTVDVDELSFTLTEESDWVDTVHLGRGLFKINVAKPPTGGPLVMTATVTYNADTVSAEKTITLSAYVPLICALYGGIKADTFSGATVDTNGNIFVVGVNSSDISAIGTGTVVKFDSNLNIVAAKYCTSVVNTNGWKDVVIDADGNVICVGTLDPATTGNLARGAITKFDNNLNLIANKYYSNERLGYLFDVVIDTTGNIFCCGSLDTGGVVLKLDGSLNLLSQKVICDPGTVLTGMAIDSSGNIICAGKSKLSGVSSYDAFVVKLDSSLNLIVGQRGGNGTYSELFYDVAIDSNGNIFCLGQTYSEGAGATTNPVLLIVKFDADLTPLVKKRYGGSLGDWGFAIEIDNSNNVLCVGYTYSEGAGSTDGLVVKFDNNLNKLAGKTFGGTNTDIGYGITLDNSGDIICVGSVASTGAGLTDGFVVKFPNNLPSGSFVSDNGLLTFSDSSFAVIDSIISFASFATAPVTADGVITDNTAAVLTSNLTSTRFEIAL